MPATKRSKALSRYDLYRACVQDPPMMVRFVQAVHGGDPAKPLALREDFSGPGSLSGEWVNLGKRHTAVAVDLDPEPLSHVRKHPRVKTRAMDVRACRDKADCVALFNFAVCELHERKELVGYFKHLAACLKKGGVVVMDIFGGLSACTPSVTRATRRLPDGSPVKYTWRTDAVHAATGMIECSMDFRLTSPSQRFARGGKPEAKAATDRTWPRAFSYNWRHWSIAELRDALADAGFGQVDLYDRLGDAVDSDGRLYVRPLDASETELGEDWVAYLAARRPG